MTFWRKLRTLQGVVVLAFLVLCACWSTTWYAIRLCLHGYPPLWGATLRFLLATLLMIAILGLWQRGRRAVLCRRTHLMLFVAGVANGLGYACVYLAEQTISGGTAAVISASGPFFAALFARLFGLEPLRARRLFGVSLGFAGVTMMMAEGLDRSMAHLSAMLLVTLSSALLWPLYGAVLKRHAAAIDPLTTCTYTLGYTTLVLLALGLFRGEPLPAFGRAPLLASLGLLYLAVIGSVVAWTVYLWLLQRLDLTVLATMGLVQPVLALLVDWLAKDVQMRPMGMIGAGLVLCGVGIAALRRRRMWQWLRRPTASGGVEATGLSGGPVS